MKTIINKNKRNPVFQAYCTKCGCEFEYENNDKYACCYDPVRDCPSWLVDCPSCYQSVEETNKKPVRYQ